MVGQARVVGCDERRIGQIGSLDLTLWVDGHDIQHTLGGERARGEKGESGGVQAARQVARQVRIRCHAHPDRLLQGEAQPPIGRAEDGVRPPHGGAPRIRALLERDLRTRRKLTNPCEERPARDRRRHMRQEHRDRQTGGVHRGAGERSEHARRVRPGPPAPERCCVQGQRADRIGVDHRTVTVLLHHRVDAGPSPGSVVRHPSGQGPHVGIGRPAPPQHHGAAAAGLLERAARGRSLLPHAPTPNEERGTLRAPTVNTPAGESSEDHTLLLFLSDSADRPCGRAFRTATPDHTAIVGQAQL